MCVSPHPTISSLNDTDPWSCQWKKEDQLNPVCSLFLCVDPCSDSDPWSTFKALWSVSVQSSSVSTFCCPLVQPVLLIHGRCQDLNSRREERGLREGNICRRTNGDTMEWRASFSFSFVSLESFPLLPLEETAAPTTQKLNRVKKDQILISSEDKRLQHWQNQSYLVCS